MLGPNKSLARLGTLVAVVAALLAVIDIAAIVLLSSGAKSVDLGVRVLRPHDLVGAAHVGGLLSAVVAVLAWRRRPVRYGSIVSAVAMVLLALTVSSAGARRVLPVGDLALLESYTLLATEGKLAVGPYSKYGWHHPGPMYFWFAAPFYALAGYRSTGLEIAVLVINVASVAIITWVTARFAGPPLAVALMTAMAVYGWQLQRMLLSVWNPYVTILPATTLTVLCAAIAAGEVRLLPVAALFASFVAQTHVGLLPYAIAVCSTALVAHVGRSRASAGVWMDVRTRRTVNLTMWLLAILWSGPVAQQMTGSPGNLALLWRFFGDMHARPALPEAFVAWADNVSGMFLPDFQIGRRERFVGSAASWPMAVAAAQVLLLPVAGVVFRSQGRRFDSALAGITLVGLIVALWSVTRMVGGITQYSIVWISAVGMLSASLLGACGIALIARMLPESPRLPRGADWQRFHRRGVRLLGAATVAAATVVAWQAFRAHHDYPVNARTLRSENRTRTLVAGLRTYVTEHAIRKPLLRIGPGMWSVTAGLVLQLQLSGSDFAVERTSVYLFTNEFAPDGTEDAEITVALEPYHRELVTRPGNTVVASADRVYLDAIRLPSCRNSSVAAE